MGLLNRAPFLFFNPFIKFLNCFKGFFAYTVLNFASVTRGGILTHAKGYKHFCKYCMSFKNSFGNLKTALCQRYKAFTVNLNMLCLFKIQDRIIQV